MMMHKSYKIRIYPNKAQKYLINKTIGSVRFIYNQMLSERINVYNKFKNNKDALYNHKHLTERQYKESFPFLKEVSSRALQQSRIDLESAYKNFFKGLKKGKIIGIPKFKKKSRAKWSYREPNVSNCIIIDNNKIKLLKLGFVKFRGLSKNFTGTIKNVTITKERDDKYYASILVEQEGSVKARKSNNIIGIDLGLKEFATCSNGEQINKPEKINAITNKINKANKRLRRKRKESNRYNSQRKKLNRLYKKRKNIQNHFYWHLINKLCSENQAIVIENLNVAGMLKNRNLSKAIHNSSWNDFVVKLKQKIIEYKNDLIEVNRFFPSSKLCSSCGQIKNDLKLSDRIYKCECGYEKDRDLNASINLENEYYKIYNISLESSDYKRGEDLRPLIFDLKGNFCEALPVEYFSI